MKQVSGDAELQLESTQQKFRERGLANRFIDLWYNLHVPAIDTHRQSS
jgi:hypothetical protein